MIADGSLLLHCLGVSSMGTLPEAVTPDDWRDVLDQALNNGVAALLYHRLRTVMPSVEVPPDAMDRLRNAALHGAAESLRNRTALAALLAALQARGIAVIVLKGGYLGQVIYESSALRAMCDLDVMVRREDLARAQATLRDLGYVEQHSGVEHVDYAQHHHLRPMAKPGGGRVELHWNIIWPAAPFSVDLEGLWQRARPAKIAGIDALVLAPEDLLLHLCLHASFSSSLRTGLRRCWDVLELVRYDTIDWDVVVSRAQDWRIGKYVYLMLRLVRELLAADLPERPVAALEPAGFPAELIGWARMSMFAPDTDSAVSPSMARLWTSRRLDARFSVLRETLWPSRAAMARIYGTRPDSRRLHFYYLLRGGDLLLRYGRHAWELWRGDRRAHRKLRAVSARLALEEWLRAAP